MQEKTKIVAKFWNSDLWSSQSFLKTPYPVDRPSAIICGILIFSTVSKPSVIHCVTCEPLSKLKRNWTVHLTVCNWIQYILNGKLISFLHVVCNSLAVFYRSQYGTSNRINYAIVTRLVWREIRIEGTSTHLENFGILYKPICRYYYWFCKCLRKQQSAANNENDTMQPKSHIFLLSINPQWVPENS